VPVFGLAPAACCSLLQMVRPLALVVQSANALADNLRHAAATMVFTIIFCNKN
jgi:hypothetical protein